MTDTAREIFPLTVFEGNSPVSIGGRDMRLGLEEVESEQPESESEQSEGDQQPLDFATAVSKASTGTPAKA